MLEAAGLAPAYRSVERGAADLAPYEAAVARVLASHEPYPALVVDRHWNVTMANRGSARLFGGDVVGTDLVRRYFGDPSAAEAIVNWPDVAWAGINRLRDELDASPFDDELRALLALAEAATDIDEPPEPPVNGLVVCPHFRIGVELIDPADEAARRFFGQNGQPP